MNDEIYEKRLDPTNEAEPYIQIDFGTIEPDNPRLVTCINCNKTETIETYSQAQQWLKNHEHHNVEIQAHTTDKATYLGPGKNLPDNWKPVLYKPSTKPMMNRKPATPGKQKNETLTRHNSLRSILSAKQH